MVIYVQCGYFICSVSICFNFEFFYVEPCLKDVSSFSLLCSIMFSCCTHISFIPNFKVLIAPHPQRTIPYHVITLAVLVSNHCHLQDQVYVAPTIAKIPLPFINVLVMFSAFYLFMLFFTLITRQFWSSLSHCLPWRIPFDSFSPTSNNIYESFFSLSIIKGTYAVRIMASFFTFQVPKDFMSFIIFKSI